MSEDRWTEMEDLMLRRSTLGLSQAELVRLEELLRSAPEEDRDWIDRLIGELDAEIAERDDNVDLPAGLRDALMATVSEAEAAIERVKTDNAPIPLHRRTPEVTVSEAAQPGASNGLPLRAWGGWAAAAAVAALWIGSSPTQETVGPEVIVPQVDPIARLVAAADRGDAQRIEWTATDDPTAGSVTGEVVWSSETQEGFMRFAGLAENAPGEFQYQLWIFDAERDERFPVDGGVFDIPAGGGEVIVPIQARLPVGQAVLFAVTVEAPGGVVVSDRSRIAVVAQAE